MIFRINAEGSVELYDFVFYCGVRSLQTGVVGRYRVRVPRNLDIGCLHFTPEKASNRGWLMIFPCKASL
jgi:hypothetical protein